MPTFPKNYKEDSHKESMQDYLCALLANNSIREDAEVRRIFKLKHFYEEAEKDAASYEMVMT